VAGAATPRARISDETPTPRQPTATAEGGAADVVAPAEALLMGTVRGLNGRPLAGVVVRLRPAEGGVASATTTAADGAFRIAGLAPGRYDVEFEREAYAPATSRIRLVAGKQRYDVGLQRQ
jgi:protocatechuate 3,4-dioxygenase beta subunit